MLWVVLSDKNWVTVHAMTTNQTEEKVWEYYILYFRDKGVMQVRLLDSKNAKIYYNWRFARFAHLVFFFSSQRIHTPLLRRVSQIPTTPVPAVLPLFSTTPQSSPTTPMPYSPLSTTPRYSPETPMASFESLSKWRETLAMILANRIMGPTLLTLRFHDEMITYLQQKLIPAAADIIRGILYNPTRLVRASLSRRWAMLLHLHPLYLHPLLQIHRLIIMPAHEMTMTTISN